MGDELSTPLLLVALAVNAALGLGAHALSVGRPAVARSALVAQVLVAAFFTAIVVAPSLQAAADAPGASRAGGLVALVAVLGLLKLLGRFEER